jgi:CheY-like chemotaxis protein
VEDHEDTREAYSCYMRSAGWAVEAVTDGEEALFIATAFAPDVIVMDLRLPVLGGLEATRRLKRDPRTQHILVVVCSGHSQLRVEARKAGCDEFVAKPCEPETLCTLLENLVAGRTGSDA